MSVNVDNDRGLESLVVFRTYIALAVVAVPLKLSIRIRIIGKVGTDDWLSRYFQGALLTLPC